MTDEEIKCVESKTERETHEKSPKILKTFPEFNSEGPQYSYSVCPSVRPKFDQLFCLS